MEHITCLKEAIDTAFKDDILTLYTKLRTNVLDCGTNVGDLQRAESTFKLAVERAMRVRTIAMKVASNPEYG